MNAVQERDALILGIEHVIEAKAELAHKYFKYPFADGSPIVRIDKAIAVLTEMRDLFEKYEELLRQ